MRLSIFPVNHFAMGTTGRHDRSRKASSLADYWSGIHASLDGRLISVQDYLRHPSSGFNAENYFRDLLKQYLPRRFAFESGFVVNVAGDRSDFIDVLIVDCLNIPPLSAEPHFKVFPAEAVVGAVEITSAPKGKVKRSGIAQTIEKLEDDVLKLAKLRGIARDREYLDLLAVPTTGGLQLTTSKINYSLSPRSFLITFGDEWAKLETYEKHLLRALHSAQRRRGEHVWINAALSMRHGMYHFKPYTKFSYERIPKHALLEFILFLNNAVSDFRTSRIDVRRYRPTLPTDAGEKPVVQP
jgi:hypothetical protein